jgi:hypothetical protein
VFLYTLLQFINMQRSQHLQDLQASSCRPGTATSERGNSNSHLNPSSGHNQHDVKQQLNLNYRGEYRTTSTGHNQHDVEQQLTFNYREEYQTTSSGHNQHDVKQQLTFNYGGEYQTTSSGHNQHDANQQLTLESIEWAQPARCQSTAHT